MYLRYVGNLWNVRLESVFIPSAIQISETELTLGYSAVANGMANQ